MIIVLVGLFFVFALIGYLIDMLRNSNTQKIILHAKAYMKGV